MRRWMQALVAAGCFAACGVGGAQAPDEYEALRRGDLNVWVVSDSPVVTSARRELQREFDRRFPENKIDFTLVAPEDFNDGLKDAAGTDDYPDVVFGLPQQPGRGRGGAGLALELIVPPPAIDQGARAQSEGLGDVRGWAILRGARHPGVARAFVAWLSDRAWQLREPPAGTAYENEAADMATRAVRSALVGEDLGKVVVDEDEAHFKGGAGRADALGASAAGAIALNSTLIAVAANERLGVVVIRTRVEGPTTFGIVYSLVILRRMEDKWRVLHLTPSVGAVELVSRYRELKSLCRVVVAEEVAVMGQVSLASPVDGESRMSPFELWWDNGSGARLLIVEWQQPAEGPPSKLYFLPDRDPREKTRIDSPFGGGGLRWRVWAIGKGGALTLSKWRDMR